MYIGYGGEQNEEENSGIVEIRIWIDHQKQRIEGIDEQNDNEGWTEWLVGLCLEE